MPNKSIRETDFLQEMIKVTKDMWLKGWDERNGGNVSYRLKKEEVSNYLDLSKSVRSHKLFRSLPELADELFLVTGSGKYFRNISIKPEENLGIVKIDETGENYEIIWGFTDGGKPTSEFPAHLLSHIARMEVTDNQNRVVMHTHATNLIALSYVLELDSKVVTKELWKMSTECLVVFPDGIGVLSWLVPGTDEIGEETAKLMKKHQMVLWPYHGIFGTGKTLDEAFGLIDTAEKAAEILVKVKSMGGDKQGITDAEFKDLADRFEVEPMDGILD
ncbi:rhamnulose-1-phosphate aldolase [Halanaerocella petrolearia]